MMQNNKEATFSSKIKSSLVSSKPEKKCCKISRKFAKSFIEDNVLIDKSLFKCEDCKRAFLSGLFVLCGTVSNPDKSNHLEYRLSNEPSSDELFIFLKECGFEPKKSRRHDSYALYFKNGDSIFEFLSYIGAQKNAFDFLNAQLEKQVRNNVNRVTNCEYANMQKTADASKKVLCAIKRLKNSGKLEKLDEKIKESARLKLGNPDLSLSALADLHTPPISKSCLNHRLEKLIKLSQSKN